MVDELINTTDGKNESNASSIAATDVRDERSLMALFIGPKSDSFLKIYDANKDKKKRFKWAGWAGVNLIAGLFPLPWFFYRKLYLEGAALLLIPVVLVFLFPEIMNTAQISLGGAIAAMANQYYVQRSTKKVQAIERLDVSIEERDSLLQSRGGVTIFGAIFGVIILCSLIGIIVFSKMAEARILPMCDSKQIQTLVEETVLNSLSDRNVPTETVTLKGFQATEVETDSRRMCSTILTDKTESTTLFFAIEWKKIEMGQYQIMFNPTN